VVGGRAGGRVCIRFSDFFLGMVFGDQGKD
jgi:hypothetical protein